MEDFRKIFTGLERAHGCTYVDKKGADGLKVKGKSFVKTEIVTDKHWDDHLNGIEPSLGIIPINENNECRWGCIDIDVYAEFNHKKLINKIKSMDLPLMVFNSKSGGAHIFIFTKELKKKVKLPIYLPVLIFLTLEPSIIQWHHSFWSESLFLSLMLCIFYLLLKLQKNFLFFLNL